MNDKLPCGCADRWVFCDKGRELFIEANKLDRIYHQTHDPEDLKKYKAAKKQYEAHRKGLTT